MHLPFLILWTILAQASPISQDTPSLPIVAATPTSASTPVLTAMISSTVAPASTLTQLLPTSTAPLRSSTSTPIVSPGPLLTPDFYSVTIPSGLKIAIDPARDTDWVQVITTPCLSLIGVLVGALIGYYASQRVEERKLEYARKVEERKTTAEIWRFLQRTRGDLYELEAALKVLQEGVPLPLTAESANVLSQISSKLKTNVLDYGIGPLLPIYNTGDFYEQLVKVAKETATIKRFANPSLLKIDAALDLMPGVQRAIENLVDELDRQLESSL